MSKVNSVLDVLDEIPGSDFPVAPKELTELLGFHIRMAHLTMYRNFAVAMAEVDLTQRQYAVLQIIGDSPRISQAEIATLLRTDRATMMAIVDRLQARGLLERQWSKEDRRRQELKLTAAGDALLGEARAALAMHESHFKKRFTPTQLADLVAALKRIHGQE